MTKRLMVEVMTREELQNEVERLREKVDSARVGPCHRALTITSAKTPSRTHTDFAVEHAGYLANAADALMVAAAALDEARQRHEDAEPGDEASAAYDVMYACEEARSEAWSGLREAVYEFRKRRDRALAAPVEQSEERKQDWRKAHFCRRCDEDTPTTEDGKCTVCTKYKVLPNDVDRARELLNGSSCPTQRECGLHGCRGLCKQDTPSPVPRP